MNILIVDDSLVVRKINANIVMSVNPKAVLVHANNGYEALVLMQAEPEKFKLVLLDVNMPVMDGRDTFAAMQKHEVLKNIPVIFITTESTKSFVVEIFKLGMCDYLIKPVQADTLKLKLMKHNIF